MARKRRPGAVKHPSRKDLRGRAKYPINRVLGTTSAVVNKSIDLTPAMRRYYDQDGTVECVAFSTDQLLTLRYGKPFDPGWLFYEAQKIDGIPGENGTTTDAVLRIVRDLGNVLTQGLEIAPLVANPGGVIDPMYGVDEFRWLSKIPQVALDEVRTLISMGEPVLLASPWYSTFDDNPGRLDAAADWGPPDGMWHQYLIDGAFDDRKAFTTPNSWGWAMSHELSYLGFMRLVSEGGGGAAIVRYAGDSSPQPPEPPAPIPDEPKKRRRKRRRRHRR